MTNFCGQNYGAGKYGNIRKGIRQCFVLMAAASLVFVLILEAAGPFLSGLFVSSADDRTWIHILNYNYDKEADRITPLPSLQLKVRDVPDKEPDILVPEGDPVPACTLQREGALSVLTLRGVGLYTVLAF